jgi:hypothetical protein
LEWRLKALGLTNMVTRGLSTKRWSFAWLAAVQGLVVHGLLVYGLAAVLLFGGSRPSAAEPPLAEAVATPGPEKTRGADRKLPPPVAADSRPANVDLMLANMLPPRSDAPSDWHGSSLCLHHPGEPRFLPPCIPPAPCHPSYPPRPADLIGVYGAPTCGPRYRGPCEPRLGTHDHCRLPRLHAACDAAFDAFYR